ncbi:MAG: ABC transporter substrate-binding protein [Clostridiales bacterium]|nr:ABC transporter substrate-binding protein [Clostridiales bacterium]
MKHFFVLLLAAALVFSLAGCQSASGNNDWNHVPAEEFCGLTYTGSLTLSYAHEFAVDYYEGGYTLLSIANGDQFLVVSEEAGVPETDVPVIQQPLSDVYLVATAAMCLFDALDGLDAITLSGTKADGWTIENARLSMEAGDIAYAGKYSEPDYELIVSSGCRLSVQSTMIYHSPEVKEKLEELGIPVLVDYSSYETHPLGRTEWIKLYAALLGKEDEAEALFREQEEALNSMTSEEPTGKTVAYFYISSTGGYAVVRKSGDYVTQMIALAGGKYLFDDLGDDETATATVSMTLEEFYATAKDADIVLYNSTIDGQLNTLEDFLSLNPLLGDFKAVSEGNVWCTNANLYQDMTRLGTVTEEMHQIFAGTAGDEMEFFYRLV